MQKSAVNRTVGEDAAAQIALERQQSVGPGFGQIGPEVVARIFDGDLPRRNVGPPGQLTPQALVEIVVNAVGIRQKSIGETIIVLVNRGVVDGSWIDRLASDRHTPSRIEPRNLVLATNDVRDVWVPAQLVLLGRSL